MADGLFGTRQAVPSIAPVAIRPAGVPSSTFIRPNQIQTGSNAQALAQSLAGLMPAMRQLAAAKEANDRDPDSEENRAFLDGIQGKTPEELRELAKQGGHNRIQRDGLMTLLGSKAASDFRLGTAEWYETEFDKNGGDLKTELEARRQGLAAELPDDAARAAFFKGTEEWSQRFLSGDLDRRVKVAEGNRNDAVTTELRLIADDGIAAGKPPEAIAAEVLRQSSANRDFRGLDGRTQNATIFSLAQEYGLRGQPEIVRALLEDDRGGVGAVGKSSEFAVKSAQLIEAAEDKADKDTSEREYGLRVSIDRQIAEGTLTDTKMQEIVKANPWLERRASETSAWVQQSENNRRIAEERAAVAAEKRALRQDATRSEGDAKADARSRMDKFLGATSVEDVEVPTATGGVRTITAKQRVDDVVKERLDQFEAFERELVEKGSTPAAARQETLKAKLAWFDGNGVPNPEWLSVFNASAVVSSIPRLAEGGPPLERMKEVAETYREIAGINPAYAESLVSDPKAREFLDTYVENRQSLAIGGTADPTAALMEAARITNRTPAEKAAYAVTAKDAVEAVEDAFGGSDFDLAPQNVDMAGRLYRGYLRREMPKDKALEKVKRTLQDQSVEVHGVRVFREGTKFPKEFAATAEGYLAKVAERHGVEDPESLYLVDTGDKTGAFAVMSKDGRPPLEWVRPQQLDAFAKTMREEETVKAAEWGRTVETEGRVRAFLKWGLNGFELERSNMTPAQAEKFLADNAERKRIDAFVRKQGERDGVTYYPMTKRWMRGGFFKTPVVPIVTWTGEEKGVVWRPAEAE